jgi:predicted  nucleic acid-binding Zn-ribbon protein
MVEPSKKVTVCGLCDKEIELNTQILINGCPFCGSFKFRTFRKDNAFDVKERELEMIVEKEIDQTEIKEGVEAIRLTSDGVFEVDVDKLLSETDDQNPIIGRDKDGSYFIKFQKTEEDN